MTHAPFAGGQLDAQAAFDLKHGGNPYVVQAMEKYFIGFVKEDAPEPAIDDGDRFPQRYDASWPYNALGFGATNPWIPPLQQPETLSSDAVAFDKKIHDIKSWIDQAKSCLVSGKAALGAAAL